MKGSNLLRSRSSRQKSVVSVQFSGFITLKSGPSFWSFFEKKDVSVKTLIFLLLSIVSFSVQAETIAINSVQFDYSVNKGMWQSNYMPTEWGTTVWQINKIDQLMYSANQSFDKHSLVDLSLNETARNECAKRKEAAYVEHFSDNQNDRVSIEAEIEHIGYIIDPSSDERTTGGNFYCAITIMYQVD